MHSVDVCREVLEAAEAIHQALGPSLFRETYTVCLAMELIGRGFQVKTKRARLTPNGVDYLFINEFLRVDIQTSPQPAEPSAERSAVRIRKGTSRPMNLLLNFGSRCLIDPAVKENLFSEIISIADTSPIPLTSRLQ